RQPEAAGEQTTPGRTSARSRLGKRSWLMIALASLALVLAVSGVRWVTQKRALIPIAVLPLDNLSEDPANDYFADGLTYELIRNLSIIEGLTVRSQTSSFSLKGQPRNIREAGKQLNAEYILEGSVLRSGQQLRINVLLVRVRDDLPLWSGKFDRELTDVFAIQEEISRNIVNGLRLKLARGRRMYETSLEAYDLYLRARALLRGLVGSKEAIGHFEEAIAKDPTFAPAYAGLATAHALRSGVFSGGGRVDIPDEIAKMRTAAETAIQLDPLLAEAHEALGMAHARDGRWKESEKSFRRAIELDPSDPISYSHFALSFFLPLGRFEEALHQLRIAEEIDLLSPRVHFELGRLLISAGRYEEGASYCRKAPADFSGKSWCLGEALLGQGRNEEAIQIFIRSRSYQANLAYAYARSGRREEAEKLAIDLSSPHQQALVFAGLGDKERTLEALGRMTVVGPVRMGHILSNPEYALLRGDPRLKALRKKAGLPE
ncbi:MAG: tetratricopeptide repeat protein, partial [Bryobacteraceae bacterium]